MLLPAATISSATMLAMMGLAGMMEGSFSLIGNCCWRSAVHGRIAAVMA
jgi:hypothetical protein